MEVQYIPLKLQLIVQTAPHLISCKLTEIFQFMCFWHFAKCQGQTVKVNFHAYMSRDDLRTLNIFILR